MKTIITLDEAIRKWVIDEGDQIDPTELFEQENKHVFLNSMQTGYKSGQSFFRENLKWFYAKDSLGVPTLWSNATKHELILYGEIGFKNALANINAICQMYTNIQLGLIARSLIETDLDFIYKDSTRIQKSYLGDLGIYNTLDNHSLFGVRIADEYGVKTSYLCSSYEYSDRAEYSIRPVVSIYSPKKIFLDTNSMEKDGAWKLTRNEC